MAKKTTEDLLNNWALYVQAYRARQRLYTMMPKVEANRFRRILAKVEKRVDRRRGKHQAYDQQDHPN